MCAKTLLSSVVAVENISATSHHQPKLVMENLIVNLVEKSENKILVSNVNNVENHLSIDQP